MNKIRYPEHIKLFSPGKTIAAYTGWQLVVTVLYSALLGALAAAGNSVSKTSAFSVIVLAAFLTAFSDGHSSSGIVSNYRKRYILFRTSPHYCEYLRKAVICSEFRKLLRLAVSFALSVEVLKLSGNLSFKTTGECLTVLFAAYSAATLYIFISRKMNDESAAFFTAVMVLIIIMFVTVIMTISFMNGSIRIFLIPFLILSVSEGVLCNRNVCREITR